MQLVARSRERKIINKLKDVLSKIEGAYALIIMTNKKMIGVVGGMGPYAGIDLVKKITSQTSLNYDHEHLSVALV